MNIVQQIHQLIHNNQKYIKDNNHTEVVTSSEQAIALYEQHQLMDWNLKANIYTQYSNGLRNIAKFEKAKSAIEIALTCFEHLAEKETDFVVKSRTFVDLGILLRQLRQFDKAEQAYEQAWDIHQQYLMNDTSQHFERAKLLMNYGVLLKYGKKFDEALEKFQISLKIYEIHLVNRDDLWSSQARLFMNIGNILRELERYDEAIVEFEKSWQIHQKYLQNEQYQLRAFLLRWYAVCLRKKGKYQLADEKFQQSIYLYQNQLVHRPDLANKQVLALMSYGVSLRLQKQYQEALSCFKQGADIYQQLLDNKQENIVDNYIELLNHYGLAHLENNNIDEADKQFQKGWDLYKKYLRNKQRPDMCLLLFTLVNNWKFCWQKFKSSRQWSIKISDTMRSELKAVDMERLSKEWLARLHQLFIEFHVFWLHKALFHRRYEEMIYILSRMSVWRMILSILDEIEQMNIDDKSANVPEPLVAFKKTHIELSEMQSRLADDEKKINDDEKQAILKEIEEKTGELETVIDELTKMPEYQVLSSFKLPKQNDSQEKENTQKKDDKKVALDFEYQQFFAKLEVNEGMVVIFDQLLNPKHSLDDIERKCFHEPLTGFMWLEKRKGSLFLRWVEIDIDNFQQIKDIFQQITNALKNNVPRMLLRCDDLQVSPQNIEMTGIHQDKLWSELEKHIQQSVWEKLGQSLDGLKKMYLVTHGNYSHLIPWQMGCSIEQTNIIRLPGLAFTAMRMGLLKQPECINNSVRGIIKYQGNQSPLPFALAEAQSIYELWQHKQAQQVMWFDNQEFGQKVGVLHIAGHGNHTQDEQNPMANLHIDKDAILTLDEIRKSKVRPFVLYLSCCMAGATVDKGGEQYGTAVEFLRKGTQQVVCSTVPLSDNWSAVLAVMSNYIQKRDNIELKYAHYKAQELLKTSAWHDDEKIRQLVIATWEKGLLEMLKPTIDHARNAYINKKNIIFKREINRIINSINCVATVPNNLQEKFAESLRQIIDKDPKQDSQQLSIVYLQTLSQHIQWQKQPDSLVLGSLIYASWVFG